MKNTIVENINNPEILEAAYRKDSAAFKQAFLDVYPSVKEELLAKAWYERLNYKQSDLSWGIKNEWKVVAMIAIIASIFALLPSLFSINKELFYTRNLGFVLFSSLIVYFSWKRNHPIKKLLVPAIIILIEAIYIKTLSNLPKSDSIIQACIHLPLFLWVLFGYVFVASDANQNDSRIRFLRFNGDLLVLSGLMLIASGIFAIITMNLFAVIKVNIENIFSNYIMAIILSIIPLVAAFLVQNNGHLVNKVSPIIARIFTPLVTVMLLVFLVTILCTGTYPAKNREYLLLFNVLLIAVMALILFSLSEVTRHTQQKSNHLILWLLSVQAIIVNGIALGSILYRINDFGFTPNRFAVLGGDILVLVNLLLVSFNLFKVIKGSVEVEKVESSIALFLPLYFVWTAFVTFGFPILFHLK
jgi:hypothetical protein